MATHFSSSVVLFLLGIFLACSAFGLEVVPDQSLSLPVKNNWVVGGDAQPFPGYVRLTENIQGQSGWMYNNELANLGNEWELELKFRIHGTGVNGLFGDGFALWLTDIDEFVPGDAFGSTNTFNGMGVFFDTFDNQNHRSKHSHPYVSGMVTAGIEKYSHDALDQHAKHREMGCNPRIRYETKERRAVVARLRYQYHRLTLDIKTNADATHSFFTSCFSLDGVTLPQRARFALSSHTGQLSDNHEILGMVVKSAYVKTPRKKPQGQKLYPASPPRVDDDDDIPTPPVSQSTIRQLTPSEVHGMLETSSVVKYLRNAVADSERQIKSLKDSHQEQLKAMNTQIKALNKQQEDIQRSYRTLVERTRAELGVKLRDVASESKSSSGVLMWSFILLLVTMGVGLVFGYRRYQYLLKRNLL